MYCTGERESFPTRPGLLKDGLLLVVLACIPACGSAISKETLREVDENIVFADLVRDPDLFKGKLALLGGEIIRIRNTEEVTWIEILHRPLRGRDRPDPDAPSGGRFLARHEGFLDPAVYSAGRLITIAGRVEGSRIQLLDEIDYRYPVIGDAEHRVWDRSKKPSINFGIGIGTYF